jgi:hypothetical protein
VIEAKSSRSGKKTEDYLKGLTQRRMFPGPRLDTYGMRGVDALSNATPKDTTETSKKWGYRIVEKPGEITIEWFNTNIVDGNQIAVLIQYGHATGTGGYVVGRDYINPAMQPIFDEIADEVWKKVKR